MDFQALTSDPSGVSTLAGIFGILFLLVLVGMGIAVGLVALATLAGLVAVSLLSTSVIVAFKQKSLTAGFTTLMRLCGLVAGAFSGCVAVLIMLLATSFPIDWRLWLPLAIVLGGLAGFAAGQLAATAVRYALEQIIRRIRGRCPECGYNLKGNTTAHCPECGRLTHPAP